MLTLHHRLPPGRRLRRRCSTVPDSDSWSWPSSRTFIAPRLLGSGRWLRFHVLSPGPRSLLVHDDIVDDSCAHWWELHAEGHKTAWQHEHLRLLAGGDVVLLNEAEITTVLDKGARALAMRRAAVRTVPCGELMPRSRGCHAGALRGHTFCPWPPSLLVHHHIVGNARSNRWKPLAKSSAAFRHDEHLIFTGVLLNEAEAATVSCKRPGAPARCAR
mmetsp:Transcript_32139/g.59188  ORF Transcript_32139/g.59188 Transcript_32139/m.59188 type:complete len:216 (+) Transcript_32139:758-1405(+)